MSRLKEELIPPKAARRPDKVLFEDMSRGARWLLAGCILLFAAFMPLMIAEWTLTRALTIAAIEVVFIPLALMLIEPRRFYVLGRVIAGLLCAGCLVYLGYELVTNPGSVSLSRPSVLNAARATLFLGAPCGWYAWKGKLI